MGTRNWRQALVQVENHFWIAFTCTSGVCRRMALGHRFLWYRRAKNHFFCLSVMGLRSTALVPGRAFHHIFYVPTPDCRRCLLNYSKLLRLTSPPNHPLTPPHTRRRHLFSPFGLLHACSECVARSCVTTLYTSRVCFSDLDPRYSSSLPPPPPPGSRPTDKRRLLQYHHYRVT